MPSQRETEEAERSLRDEFYDALINEIQGRFGRKPLRAAKHLGVGKSRTYGAMEDKVDGVTPQRATLEAYIRWGGPRLSAAAQAYKDFIDAKVDELSAGEFSFLYAAMQLVVANENQLLRHIVERAPVDQREVTAIGALLSAYIAGNFHFANYRLARSRLEAAVPIALQDGQECARTAQELFDLAAADDDIRLFRLLNRWSYWEVPNAESDEPFSASDEAHVLLSVYAALCAARNAGETFIRDGAEKPHLKRRPLYKVSVHLCNLMHQSAPHVLDVVAAGRHAIESRSKEEGKKFADSIEGIVRCVTGNAVTTWIGESMMIMLNEHGVRFQRGPLLRPNERVELAREAKVVPGLTPRNGKNNYVIFDARKIDAWRIIEPLAPPFDNVVFAATHKLHRWKPGDRHVRPFS